MTTSPRSGLLDRAAHHLDRVAFRVRDRFDRTPHWPDRFAGAYLGWGGRDPVFTGPEHAALIIGPPRSGKTSAIIIPAIALWDGPVVTTSTKDDIAQATHQVRSRRAQTWIWDPTGTVPLPTGTQPLRWSPLSGCEDWDTAIDRAWILTHSARPDPTSDGLHWTERAAALLAPLLHACALAGTDMSGLLEVVHSRETTAAIDELSLYATSKPAHDLLAGIAATDSRELSGIWSTTDSVLAAYRSQAALSAANHPNFDPATFAQSCDTIHLVAGSHRSTQHAPAICALLDQIRQHTLNRPHRPMLWALDEVANIAPLPTLPTLVADSGSQGLLILACLQDLSQARHRWGPRADGFLTLFTTTVLLAGVADPDTLKTVTTLAGQADRRHDSYTRTGFLKTQQTVTTRKEPLLPENVVAHGRPGLALHVRSTNPSWLRLTPWHATPWLARHLKGPM